MSLSAATKMLRKKRPLTAMATSIIAVMAGAAIAPSPAMACSANFPDVYYRCSTVSANTAVYTSLSRKMYNEMYEGRGASLGIYLEDSKGSRFYYTYGSNYVYDSFTGANVRAFCWNRSSTTIIAECLYTSAP